MTIIRTTILKNTLVMLGALTVLAHAPHGWSASKKSPSAQPEGGEQQISLREFTSRFTVRVVNQMAEVFSADQSGGHGTGFLYEVREDKDGEAIGVIFTNNHVIDRQAMNIRNIQIEFTTDTDIPETVSAKVAYESQIHDFAVLEFRIKDLKRVRHKIAPAMFPKPESPLYHFSRFHAELAGRETLAQGNPFDSKAMTTFGRVNGLYRSDHQGDFIQTQTPINPGNSGGPLIDLQTLEVIGINTMKIASNDADAVGYAIPIGEVIEEYLEWRKSPAIARPRTINVRWGTIPAGELKIIGAYDLIEKRYPDFFSHYAKVLRIHDADPKTGLKTGDQVVAVAGKPMPPTLHEMTRRLQRAGESIEFEVIRNGALVKLNVPVADRSYAKRRQLVNFVYLSGLILAEMGEHQRWQIDEHLESTVMIVDLLDTPEINFGAVRVPDANSIVVGVNIQGRDYKIRNLRDLKGVLNTHRGARFIRLDVWEPIRTPVLDQRGGMTMALDVVFGNLVYRNKVASYLMPISEVVTPFQFSRNNFEKQFSFDEGKPQTRDWRRFVEADRLPTPAKECEVALDLGGKSKPRREKK